MKAGKRGNFMERVAAVIVDKRNVFFLIFAAAAIFCAFSRNWVQICDDITAYLPDNTETRQGLDLMEQEFTTFGTAKVMVANITYERALELQHSLGQLEGVKSVDFDDTAKHYADASALFDVTFVGDNNDPRSEAGLERVKDYLSGYDLYLHSEVGNPLEAIIDQEMLVVDIIAVIIIVLVLLLTSRTYAEIPVLLITFGAAAILNMGTNYLMGEVSFVTNSIAIVMQLALAIDYAIILCHRYTEEREQMEPREAAITALSHAIPEISASSLTTISGLLALCLMEFKLGYDMGSVLIKAILLSMLSVFLLMPGLLVLFSGWIDKTHHRNFVPKINFLGKAVYATRFVMPVLFVALIASAFVFSHRANYVYSSNSVTAIRQNETQLARKQIEDTFQKSNMLAVIVPAGDYEKEEKLIADLKELPQVESVTGLADIDALDGYKLTSALTPREFSEVAGLDIEVAKLLYTGYAMNLSEYGQIATNLDNYRVPLLDMFSYLFEQRKEVVIDLDQETEELLDDLEEQLHDARLQLMSEDYSRMVVMLNLPTEGEESYQYLDIIHGIAARYYDEYYVVGDTTSCSDLRSSFEKDNLIISILTVLFVVIVLIFTFKSAGLPLLLIAIIQGSIWSNFSIPYLKGSNLFFMTYLIVSSIQMGANIDYAIVISSRYMELKEKLPLKQAMTETLNLAFPTIITSGSMMALAGMAIGLLTSNEIISGIGVYIGTGTTISIFLVMCVLPQILLTGDIIIRKTSFTINRGGLVQSRSGLIRIDGRVRGQMNGFIDAEVHGYFRGELNARVDMGKAPVDGQGHNLELEGGIQNET
ncbi:MAG: RND family transporter [Candidatus Limivicinus sp.]